MALDGYWLPLGEVLVGLVAFLVPDPRWAARALSLVTGTLTVPLLASLSARIVGPEPALAAAALLAVLPIHVTLSASSLIDVSALFFVVLTLRLATGLPAEGRSRPRLLALAVAGGLAAGLRYEAWGLLLLLPLHRLVATRRPLEALLVAALLAPVPVLWITFGLGGFEGLWAGFERIGASGATVGGRAVPIGEALAIATTKLALLTGPATLALAAAGFVLLARSPSSAADRLLWLAATIGALVFVVVIARERGPSFVDRYALAATVLALPLATSAIAPALTEFVRAAALVAAIAGSTIVATFVAPPELYLARRFPETVVELAHWLDSNRRPRETVLFTRAGWLPTYIPLLHRIGRDEYRIVSWYLSEPALRAFVARSRPTFLVTRDGDETLVERVRAAGAEPSEPLARFGRLEVRRLRLAIAEPRR